MKKLAVQNNTLWMLTAGFATPVMTALICNASEPFLAKYQEKIRNKKADGILTNIDKYSKKYAQNNIENKLKAITKEYSGKPIDDKLTEKLVEIFTEDLDAVTSESLKKDLKAMLSDKNYSVSEKTAKNISKNMKEILLDKNFSKEFVDAVIPNENEIVNIFKENAFIKDTENVGLRKIQDKIAEIINSKTEIFNAANPDVAEDAKSVRRFIFANNSKTNPITKELTAVSSSVFDSNIIAKLTNAAKIFDNFIAKQHSLDEYALVKVGSAPETVIANYWNDVSKDLIKSFGITDKELEQVRFDKNLMGKLLREKIEQIVSDKNSYEKVMNALVEKVASLNSKIKPSDMTSHMLKGDGGNKTAYERTVDTLFNSSAESIKSSGFVKTAEALKGKGEDEFGSAKAVQKAFVEERLLGVKVLSTD